MTLTHLQKLELIEAQTRPVPQIWDLLQQVAGDVQALRAARATSPASGSYGARLEQRRREHQSRWDALGGRIWALQKDLDQETDRERRRTLESRLAERQAERIEATLARYGLAGRVTGGILAPRWVQFHVHPGQGTRISQIRNIAEELALELDAETCRVARNCSQVRIEIPRPDPQPIHLLPLHKRIGDIPLGAVVLGLADNCAPLLVRLPAPQAAHVLIAGATGSRERTERDCRADPAISCLWSGSNPSASRRPTSRPGSWPK